MSVLIRSHNSAPYVRRAVFSALRQRVDFPVEIVVSDDASDDGTLRILSELVDQGEGAISLIRRPKRVGYAQNFFQTLAACRGRYVAVLDADDFWSSPEKLARQVHVLESNPQLSAAGHRYLKVTGDAAVNRYGHVSRRQSNRITPLSFYRGAWIKNSTIMIRASCLSAIPDWVRATPSEDIAVQALCVQQGNMAFLNEVMTVCQLDGRGVTSSLGTTERMEWSLKSWLIIRRYAPAALQSACEPRLSTLCFNLADTLQTAGREAESLRYRTTATSLGRDRWQRRLRRRLRGTIVHSVLRGLRTIRTLRLVPRQVDPVPY